MRKVDEPGLEQVPGGIAGTGVLGNRFVSRPVSSRLGLGQYFALAVCRYSMCGFLVSYMQGLFYYTG